MLHLTDRQLFLWRMRQSGLSISEIASRLGVSRQAVHKNLQVVENKIYRALTAATAASKVEIRRIDAKRGVQPTWVLIDLCRPWCASTSAPRARREHIIGPAPLQGNPARAGRTPPPRPSPKKPASHRHPSTPTFRLQAFNSSARHNVVLIRTKSGTLYMLSPEDPEDFLGKIEAIMAKMGV